MGEETSRVGISNRKRCFRKSEPVGKLSYFIEVKTLIM